MLFPAPSDVCVPYILLLESWLQGCPAWEAHLLQIFRYMRQAGLVAEVRSLFR
jgi:hypothetical protein